MTLVLNCPLTNIMFDNFKKINIETDDQVVIQGVQGGLGPALLLLHGFPETHLIWRYVVDRLAETFSVVAIDLRGYGASSKPTGLPDHSNYSKRAMAQDCVQVMSALGHEQFHVCGHDRGGRVAHSLGVNFPERIERVMLLDICPTLYMYEHTDFRFAKAYYHWFFLIQPSPLPEQLIVADPKAFIMGHMGGYHATASFISPDIYRAYIDHASTRDKIHGMCEDYRASASIDLEHSRQDMTANRRLTCPLRVLWGKRGLIEQCYNVIDVWKEVAVNVDGGALDCGHYVPEEAPEALLSSMRDFFV